MNSLTDLNSYSQTQLTYTDDRQAAVIFDRATGSNQSVTTAVGQSHYVVPGIEITEIIKPDLLNIYYEVNVSGVTGATVTWASLPSGVVLNNLGSGIYRITNIDTVEQWNAVKSPSINISSSWDNDFTYTCSVHYDPSKSKSWTNSVTVTVTAFISAQSSITASLTGLQGSQANLNAMAIISSLGGKRQRSQANWSSLASLTGQIRYAIGKLRSNMTSTATVFAQARYNPGNIKSYMTTTASQNTTANIIKSGVADLTAQFTQTIFNTDYFAVSTLTADNASATSFGTEVSIDVLGDNLATQTTISGTSYVYVFSRSGTTWSQATTLSSKDAPVALGNGYLMLKSGSQTQIYSGSGSSWTSVNTFSRNPTAIVADSHGPTEPGFMLTNSSNQLFVESYRSDNSTWYEDQYSTTILNNSPQPVGLSFVSPSGTRFLTATTDAFNNLSLQDTVWTYSGGFSGGAGTITAYEGLTYAGTKKGISLDYNIVDTNTRYYIAGLWADNISNPSPGQVKIYSGTSNDKVSITLQSQYPAVNDRFGYSLANAGQYLAIGAPGDRGGAVYLYKRPATYGNDPWTLETIFRPNNYVDGMEFGASVDISSNGTYIAIAAPGINSGTGSGTVFVYRRVPT